MPDVHRIRRELTELLSRSEFKNLLQRINQFGAPGAEYQTAASIAEATAQHLLVKRPLLAPVEVVLLEGPIELYRAHDAGARLDSARTLGRSWVSRQVLTTIWDATARHQGTARRAAVFDFLRASNFILPEWNDMTKLACMKVPAGNVVAAARGRGDWQAMMTRSQTPRPDGAQPITSADDVMQQGMMPLPGTQQYLIPLWNDMWVQPVPNQSPRWPFAS